MKIVKCKGCIGGAYFLSPRIIRFENNDGITQADIENLFVGAFRLLRASIKREVEKEYKERLDFMNRELERYKK